MSQSTPLAVSDLTLDLSNYRTLPQPNELAAVHTMIALKPAKFWALADSLTGGFLPTENIIVLKRGKELVVKEGNRRIGALKLILGILSRRNLEVPDDLEKKIASLGDAWKKKNAKVPCAVFEEDEAEQVDRIVTLAHALGQDAARLDWTSVAKARHNRDQLKESEPALDLLEKYLKNGKQLSRTEAELWSADYYLSVLEDAMKRLAPRLGFDTRGLAAAYPDDLGRHRKGLEAVILGIGRKGIGFEDVRAEEFGVEQGLPPASSAALSGGPTSSTSVSSALSTTTQPGSTASSGGAAPKKPRAAAATPQNEPKSVRQVLRKFVPRGKGREKVAQLLVEARALKHEEMPFAFCFILRALFEISAKAYCADHAIGTTKGGNDRFLVDVLNDVVSHMTNQGQDKEAKRRLHGAIAELRSSSGFLSVTSMNQLVHHRSLSVTPTHISSLFHNIFPLLEAMNS